MIERRNSSSGFGPYDYSENHEESKKRSQLELAKAEVELCTPDSIGLACDALKLLGIELPELITLYWLQQNASGQNRDAAFAEQSAQLKQEVIRKIEEQLK